MLKVVHDETGPNAVAAMGSPGSSLLDEIVRDGARPMLAAALQAEVAAYIEAHVARGRRGRSAAGGPQRLSTANGR